MEHVESVAGSLQYILPAVGVFIMFLLWLTRSPSKDTKPSSSKKVSIVIPARNEEVNIGRVLTSLMNLSYKNVELIVVDDSSIDKTYEIAQSFNNVRVIKTNARPDGWNGKQWACQVGSKEATGDYILFTDADTYHYQDGLTAIVSTMDKENVDVGSQIPYLVSDSFTQRLLGSFFPLLYSSMVPLHKIKAKNTFAIGQYLIFKRSIFEKIGGYEHVKNTYVEDIPVVQKVIRDGYNYRVLPGCAYETKMYETFREFVKGWRRNFRAGFQSTNLLGLVKILGLISLYTISFQLSSIVSITSAFLATSGATILIQRKYGNYSVLGGFLFPFGVIVFFLVTILSLYDVMLKKPLVWKGRSY
jgi:cellulose synthase/poly-beta-1,6-N-acetylglucosamine synthase-like glycosyltransferase